MRRSGILLAVALFVCQEAAAESALGKPLPRGAALRDLRGNRRALHDLKGHKAIVVAFVGADCPVSNLYLPELVAKEKAYRDRQAQFVAVYPNEREDLDKVAGHSYDRDVPFPVFKDTHQKLADLLGVTRVPAVVVLDGDLKVRYRGRVNDQYGAGSRRAKPTREDLYSALDEVLAGKPVSVPETEVDGCLLDRAVKQSAKAGVSFSRDVAPLLQKYCQACHRPEQAAPFSLLNYDDAVKHAAMIREVTTQRRMPPWQADSRYGKFSNDRHLSRDEIATLSDWVEAGMPKGDPKDLPKPVEFPKGWALGKPDLVIQMPKAFDVPATGSLPYQNFIVETGFPEDRWVTMAEARPGAPGVVHHIVVYILRGGNKSPVTADGSFSVLVGWAPGDLGLVCPPETALRVPKGAKLRIEMHYTPNGTAVTDRSSVGLTFAKRPPKYEMFMNEFANTAILVPPHDPHYRAEATLRLPADARLLSFVPHMHWRGKSFRYDITLPGGKRETILSVPRWDFNWQNVYRFDEPLRLPKGAKVHAVAHFDNSGNNPLNPAPEKKVRFGLQTWDEMMVGWACYVWERPETAAELAKSPPSQADQLFDRFDTNGDDVITPDEIPERMQTTIKLLGIKVPERMTRQEFAEWFAKMRGKR
ncbi:MAG: redoxin domain-containing protein [Gemmataceae bacterium]